MFLITSQPLPSFIEHEATVLTSRPGFAAPSHQLPAVLPALSFQLCSWLPLRRRIYLRKKTLLQGQAEVVWVEPPRHQKKRCSGGRQEGSTQTTCAAEADRMDGEVLIIGRVVGWSGGVPKACLVLRPVVCIQCRQEISNN